jgi:hypothetical protein
MQDGQKYAKDRSYVPLPMGMVKSAAEQLKSNKIARN